MSNKSRTKRNSNVKPEKVLRDPYPLDVMADFCGRALLWLTVVALPLMVGSEKYSAITRFKSVTFSVIFLLSAAALMFSVIINAATRVTDYPAVSRERLRRPPFAADAAILAYWVLMLLSCLLSGDRGTAFGGLSPRNNGFWYQTMYIAAYFIVSRCIKPRRSDALVFQFGGAVLAATCLLHFFGVDLFDIGSVNGAEYAGPFWTSTTYRFLGPVGNVNLGSYILAIALVISAGLYVNKIKLDFDRFGLISLACFGVILFAELNINTDAGIVAMAAAAVLLPPVLCGSLGHLNRLLHVYTVAACVLLFDHSLVEVRLRGEGFGKTGLLLTAASLLLTVLSAAGLIRWLTERTDKRTVMYTAAGVSAFIVVSFNIFAAVMPKSPSSVLTRWTNLGSPSVIFSSLLAVFAIFLALLLWSPVKLKASAKHLRTVCAAAVCLAVIGGIALSLAVTAPEPAAAGSVSGASAALEAHDLQLKSDNMLQELGQMLRGNLNDHFGHNRLFTWKRTLRLIRLRPLLGQGCDNFKRVFALYFHDEAVKMFPSSNGSLDKAHNEFLDVLFCNGILGLLAWVGFLGSLVWYALRRSKHGLIAPVFGIAVVSYMAHSFFGYQLPIQSPVMWVMFGAAAAFIRSEEDAFEPVSDNI